MTLSLLLILLLALEAIGLSSLGIHLFRAGHTPLLAIAVPILIATAWRYAFLLLNFALSGALRGLTWRERAKLMLRESWTMFVLYQLAQPFALVRTWLFKHFHHTESGGPVIVLVHGFLCNSGMWQPMLNALDQAGFRRNYVISLDPFYRSMQKSQAKLLEKLGRICAREDVHHVVLIGHSMGGVLARIVQHEQPDLVQAAITIGAPHAGTDAARFVSSLTHGPARPDSTWLLAFNHALLEPAPAERLLNIWSTGDNIVYPQQNAGLTTADLQLNGIGHLTLANAPPTLQATVNFLKTLTH
jgi:triacylglycerol lipase